MKKNFYNIIIGSLLFLLYLTFGYLFNANHKWMILLLLSTTFIVSFFLFRQLERKVYFKKFLILVLPLWLTLFITSMFAGFVFTLPYLIFVPLSAFLGAKFAIKTDFYLPVTAVILFPIIAFFLFPNHLVWSNNRGARVDNKFSQLTLLDENRDTVKLATDKIIALDFWTTSCAICFKKFPDYEKVYEELKENPQIQMYSINVPLKRDSFERTVDLVNKLNYSFPTLYSISSDEINELGVQTYPHLIILKNGRIRYNGRLEVSDLIIVNNLKNELKRLLNE